ncbi:MAG TPA: hypothetical protein VHV54_22085, partial [Candidatus Binatia bacterium]|nr:hypothetical protein [Candidatus Binatia bacterium]
DENKKRVFKGLSESDLADLAVYYATLKQRSIFFARRAAMQRRRSTFARIGNSSKRGSLPHWRDDPTVVPASTDFFSGKISIDGNYDCCQILSAIHLWGTSGVVSRT